MQETKEQTMRAKPTDLPSEFTAAATEGETIDKDRATSVAQTLLQESDRGCVIFGAAILEGDLEALLRAFCRNDEASVKQVVDPLFHTYAPLATFSAKIQIAFPLRLITHDLRRQMDVVRRMRNDFAHEAGPMTFESRGCQDRLRLLIADGKPKAPAPGDGEPVPGMGGTTKRKLINRIAFVLAVSGMSARIAFITEQAEAGHDPRLIVQKLEAAGL